VATVSAGGDEEVGQMVKEAMDKVSVDGVITVEESKSLATELDVTEGMAFDRGYSSPYFVTDGDRQICEFDNALLLLTDRKVSAVADLVPVLEAVQQSGSPLVVLAEEVDGEALATLVVTRIAAFCRSLRFVPRHLVSVARQLWQTLPSSRAAR
jgi:chaperonin GroEL